MSSGIILIISILVLSILIIAVVSFISFKKMKPTLKNFKALNSDIQQIINFYDRESQHLQQQVQTLNHDIVSIQHEFELKKMRVQDFTDRQSEFQSSLHYLQDHVGDYSKGIANNVKNEIQKDGPKMFKVFKQTLKKTARKQKQRFKNK